MRNLKKILALVLAMVMAFSVMSVAGAFSDDEKFSGNYAEAAEVLEGLSVFQGYPDGSFRPDQTITRAEVAALIYRIATGDTSDANVGLYKYQGKFTDVAADHWAAGYINYCANAEYIRGTSATTFDPEAKVTGYQVLAMILRAVGYDKNKEFTGTDWEIQVARVANDLQITGTVAGVSLRDAAPRQIVAELLFQTLNNAKIVNYTPALGYQSATLLGFGAQTLGQKVFNLKKGDRTEIDKWGRPGYYWTAYDYDATVACIEEPYLAQYTTAVTECQIAADANYGYTMWGLGIWVDQDNVNGTYDVVATDVVTKLGAQGRLTEVYSDRIVMIDTMLAQVAKVTAATYDKAGHMITPATMTLNVYDKDNEYTAVTLYSYGGNWEYTVGQMLLVNPVTAKNTATQTAAGNQGNTLFGGHNAPTTVVIYDVAESVTGAQSLIYYRSNQHVISGVTYPDANCFHLDMAGTDISNHIWYFDQYKNVIGAVDIATQYTYGTIDKIQWINPTVLGSGYAVADLVLMDGTKLEKVIVSAIADTTDATPTPLTYADSYVTGTVGTPSLENGYVSTVTQLNTAAFHGNYLYRLEKNANDVYTLWAVANIKIPSYRMGTNVTVTSKVAAIQKGTEGAENNAPAYIVTDSTTQYLIQSASGAFTTATGFNNIASYVNATVDYVDVNGDGRADYVFIKGDPTTAKSSALFYPLYDSEGNALAQLDPATGIYSVYGLVNGVPGTIQVKNPAADTTLDFWSADRDNITAKNPTKQFATAIEFVDHLLNHANKNHSVYDVKLDNNFVVGASAVTSKNASETVRGEALNDWTDNFSGPYTGLNGKRYAGEKAAYAYYNADVLSVTVKDDAIGYGTTENFNVTNATKFIIDGMVQSADTVAEGTIFDHHIIHVVFNNATQIASEVYVYTKENGNADVTVPDSVSLVKATMNAKEGAEVVVASTFALTADNTTMKVYTQEGVLVFTSAPVVTPTEDGNYTLTVANTLTAGQNYYAVVTIAGGYTLTTPLIQAQTAVETEPVA